MSTTQTSAEASASRASCRLSSPGSATTIWRSRTAVPPDRKSTRLNSSHTEIYTLSLHDALPIFYHPDFGGSFSIKSVLPALVPGLGYDDLEIQDGSSASTALEALLLDADAFSLSERKALRSHLLGYCERDTLAMVRLHERLRELTGLSLELTRAVAANSA